MSYLSVAKCRKLAIKFLRRIMPANSVLRCQKREGRRRLSQLASLDERITAIRIKHMIDENPMFFRSIFHYWEEDIDAHFTTEGVAQRLRMTSYINKQLKQKPRMINYFDQQHLALILPCLEDESLVQDIESRMIVVTQ